MFRFFSEISEILGIFALILGLWVVFAYVVASLASLYLDESMVRIAGFVLTLGPMRVPLPAATMMADVTGASLGARIQSPKSKVRLKSGRGAAFRPLRRPGNCDERTALWTPDAEAA